MYQPFSTGPALCMISPSGNWSVGGVDWPNSLWFTCSYCSFVVPCSVCSIPTAIVPPSILGSRDTTQALRREAFPTVPAPLVAGASPDRLVRRLAFRSWGRPLGSCRGGRRRAAALVDEAVGVARGVAALEAGLVHAQAAEVVAVREEARVSGHAAGVDVRIDSSHPGTHPLGVEDLVPARVERVRRVNAPPVPAHLDHLRSAAKP